MMALDIRKEGTDSQGRKNRTGLAGCGKNIKRKIKNNSKVLNLVLENGRVSNRSVEVPEHPLWGQSIFIWGAVLFRL